jgi:energy-coupling factor transporter ATP-binding protein EcfA2
MALFDELHDGGQTILLVTHEHDIAERARRTVTLRDGVVSSDEATGRGLVAAGSASAAPVGTTTDRA